jgi:molybdenum cofactor cytidylyltransferase
MIAAVVLAAGSARRFDGTQKLLASVPHDGAVMPLVRLTVSGLIQAGLQRIVVVVGRDAGALRLALDGLHVNFVNNADYVSGMSSSLRAGVADAMRRWPDVEGVLIALGDQPLLGTGIIESLVKQLGTTPLRRSEIVAPRFRGELGTPVLFARDLTPELLSLSGDSGARSVVERDRARVRYLDFNRASPLDVDTVADLAALKATSDR